MPGTPSTVPLNRLDGLFLGLDSDTEPWNVHFEVQVPERLDPGRLAGAVKAAASRHPLARARLASWRYTDRGYRWQIADELPAAPIDVVECAEDAALQAARARLMSRSPSLDAPPPFAMLLAHGPDRDSLVLNLHHAAADGIAAARLMRSILRAYAGEEDPLPVLDPLAVRDVHALAGTASPAEGAVRLCALARAALRRSRAPSRLARERGPAAAGYDVELLQLSRAETERVRALRSEDATVNDVLLAALAIAVRRWNAAHGRRADHVTVSMPVNLRPRPWRSEVVGNFASYVTVPGPAGDDLAAVVEAISRETARIKRDGLAGLVVDLLAGPSRMTIVGKRRLRELIPLGGNVVVDTASLSNLGVLELLGDRVEGVYFSPPGRMPLGAALGAVTHGDRLGIALRFRRAQFAASAARRFARVYRDVLLSGRPPEAARTASSTTALVAGP